MEAFRGISLDMSPPVEATKPLTKRQLHAISLRADGNSWDQIAKRLECTERTLRSWRKHPHWDSTLAEVQKEWIHDYESRFKRLMPKAAERHEGLLDSESEAVRVQAVNSAHLHYSRNVKEQEVRTEIEELKSMVATLLDQLAQERVNG